MRLSLVLSAFRWPEAVAIAPPVTGHQKVNILSWNHPKCICDLQQAFKTFAAMFCRGDLVALSTVNEARRRRPPALGLGVLRGRVT